MENIKADFYIICLFNLCLLLPSCSLFRTLPVESKMQLQGEFKSTKGVMQVLSCYCYNGGYLTRNNSKVIPICFEKSTQEVTCSNIAVVGYYKTVKLNSDPNNVCKDGEMTYFNVTQFTCK